MRRSYPPEPGMKAWDWAIFIVALGVVGTLFVMALVGCAAPVQHGRAAFDAWKQAHVTTVIDHPWWLPPSCGFYNRYNNTVVLDPPCINALSYGDPGIAQNRTDHEYGHALDYLVFLGAHGTADCSYLPNGEIITCRTWEETASCVAVIASGVDFAPDPPKGYWSCPPSEKARIQGLMEMAGAW